MAMGRVRNFEVRSERQSSERINRMKSAQKLDDGKCRSAKVYHRKALVLYTVVSPNSKARAEVISFASMYQISI